MSRSANLRQVLLSSLEGPALAAVRHVPEKPAVPRAVRAVPPFVEPDTDEPAEGPRGRLVDAADAAPLFHGHDPDANELCAKLHRRCLLGKGGRERGREQGAESGEQRRKPRLGIPFAPDLGAASSRDAAEAAARHRLLKQRSSSLVYERSPSREFTRAIGLRHHP